MENTRLFRLLPSASIHTERKPLFLFNKIPSVDLFVKDDELTYYRLKIREADKST